MQTLKGRPVCAGIAGGPLFYLNRGEQRAVRRTISDKRGEHARVAAAKKQAVAELEALRERALPQVGEQGAMIFEIHQMMVEDEDFGNAIAEMIETQSVSAEYAVAQTADSFARMFSEMEDPYIRQRAVDLRDISQRLVACLCGGTALTGPSEPSIIAADDLTPSETIQLDQKKVLAFATAGGGENSHTAILARGLGIPAVIGLGEALTPALHGKPAILDGGSGRLYIRPDRETAAAMGEKKRREDAHKALLARYKGLPNTTLAGREIDVWANVGGLSEVGQALENDAGGIGLFRTEFLFLERGRFPTEEEQFAVYKTVVERMAGRPVIFRTLDIGADKQLDYFPLAGEENPALGLRGIRLCLEYPDLLKTQLGALLRASAFGGAAILFPMVSSPWELAQAKAALGEVKGELAARGLAFDPEIRCGIMIETPAAALISDLLAPMVDFFSVGTNDLTQYTLAADRQNHKLARYADARHQAVLRLIEMSAKNAHAHGRRIGICGELAGDLTLTEAFLRMGIDQLSVPPAKVLELRRLIRETKW